MFVNMTDHGAKLFPVLFPTKCSFYTKAIGQTETDRQGPSFSFTLSGMDDRMWIGFYGMDG